MRLLQNILPRSWISLQTTISKGSVFQWRRGDFIGDWAWQELLPVSNIVSMFGKMGLAGFREEETTWHFAHLTCLLIVGWWQIVSAPVLENDPLPQLNFNLQRQYDRGKQPIPFPKMLSDVALCFSAFNWSQKLLMCPSVPPNYPFLDFHHTSWVPEAFYARFPVSVKSLKKSGPRDRLRPTKLLVAREKKTSGTQVIHHIKNC